MMVSLQKKIAFLSMPKCASTSIEKALMPYSQIIFTGNPKIKHMNYRGYVKKVEPIIISAGVNDVTTFCLFREPLEWLQSWYRYRARKALADPKAPRHRNYTGDVSFQEFVLAYINNHDVSWNKVGRQSRFVSDKEGRVAVDKVFRLDKQKPLYDFLQERIGMNLEIPQKNISPHELDYTLDDSVKREAMDFLSEEYEIYETL
ncbi:sulfotransferase family 2 domain-containing protein [Halomonas elongata]|uniref:Sulfotransferase domain protein n=1 Tax=Halomonas elongata (strain ATCC 33173 / DSM 2581 / NBRC 15536 / NCIMB 2198 / 1H9) TaxID=768066 RepID=A0A1R4A4A5_HALED|nr:sulfotransferase family 2 domain-containing protein [Halomonas elongata]WBF19559.1 sulfotransferase family protein [Halomonas elongata]WPU48423.1 sulfotransferase family 2 domain-containing protein [Halomonas elongata DSM 2581]SJK83789.1 sulfotransferase domain protein [Halomonas elongata DSM 2581]